MTMNRQLLQLFQNNDGQYVSGEQISRELGVSRTAVWKHIQALKEDGYEFAAAPRLGYKLLRAPDRIRPEELAARLRTRTFGRTLHCYEETGSTQNIAHELVKKGAPEGTLVVAERQTTGRGRLGRHWHSPKGKGIYMSLILKPAIPLQFTPQLTLVTAVALCRAIRKQVPNVDPGIKWPNDLLVDGKKISGILLESSAENESLQHVITGVGIGANLEEDDYPDELKGIATSLLLASGKPVDRTALVAEFLAQLEELYGLYLQQGFAPIRLLWEASSVSLGRNIRVQTPAGTVEGTAQCLDEWGGLVLALENGRTYTVYTADAETLGTSGRV